jgi:hypothetical protein
MMQAVALLLVCGCGFQPRAPALQDEPVCQNLREGFRFVVPEGWTLRAKTELPPGRVEKECRLVLYERLRGDAPAAFEVTRADLPADADLEARLKGPSLGVSKWELTAPVEQLEVGGTGATRMIFSGSTRRGVSIKEVVTIRRNDRVYFFTGSYDPEDRMFQEELHRLLDSVIWNK